MSLSVILNLKGLISPCFSKRARISNNGLEAERSEKVERFTHNAAQPASGTCGAAENLCLHRLSFSDGADDGAAMIQGAALRADRLKQDGIPVKIEELFLAAGEATYVDNLVGIDAHSLERRMVGDRRDYEVSVVFEANEPAIEEMINARRQEQAILAVKSLLVARVPPRLAVTCHQVHWIVDAGDTAS
jgi:hypothetical protein